MAGAIGEGLFGSVASNLDPIETCLEQLNNEIRRVLQKAQDNRGEIDNLRCESNAFKAAYMTSESNRKYLEDEKSKLSKENEDMKSRLHGYRVVIVIDGDGNIFDIEFLKQGLQGGHEAAKKLNEHTTKYLAERYGSHPFQLRAYVFLNKRGLSDALGRAGHTQAKVKLDDFVQGFNQASERFLVVDVGHGKEAADAKVKEDELRLPQTFRLIFGGCHDNGYISTLRSQITGGYGEKLILLPGYSEMASGIAELDFPLLRIPELFIYNKLRPASPVSAEVVASQPIGPTFPESPLSNPGVTRGRSATTPGSPPDAPKQPPPTTGLSQSYSSAVQIPAPKRAVSPESWRSDGRCTPEPSSVSKHPTPNLPLSKHKPAPCSYFYLTGNCSSGVACKYGHDYLLEAEHYEEMKLNAKKGPCPYVNRDEICPFAEDCLHGHSCPAQTSPGGCRFFKEGRCKFTGANMHRTSGNKTA